MVTEKATLLAKWTHWDAQTVHLMALMLGFVTDFYSSKVEQRLKDAVSESVMDFLSAFLWE